MRNTSNERVCYLDEEMLEGVGRSVCLAMTDHAGSDAIGGDIEALYERIGYAAVDVARQTTELLQRDIVVFWQCFRTRNTQTDERFENIVFVFHPQLVFHEEPLSFAFQRPLRGKIDM